MPDAPRVTLLMTVRERHGLTLASIDNILANTAIPHRFVFAHGALPAWIEEGLAAPGRAGRVASRRFDGNLWPQHLRKALAGEIDTEYVCFIDNDIVVSPGWLERLLECAVQTRAGAVGPLYLWGDGKSAPRVHMAGGRLREQPVQGGKVLDEEHQHLNEDPARLAGRLARGPCDTLEFHCMLMPTVLARDPAMLDDAIACVHEHIDVALTLRSRGLARVLEPAAQVTYLAYAPMTLEDLPLLRWRWAKPAVEASIAAFARKWGVVPDDRSFAGVRGYANDLRTRNDPLRPQSTGAGLDAEMARTDLPQSRSALLDLAAARGYAAGELAYLARGCDLAAVLMDGGYRPCGRPFVQHLIGTAGVLARYDFTIDVVLEGLLHAAYTHRRLPPAAVQQALAGLHPNIEVRVRDYTGRSRHAQAPTPAAASPREAEVAAIEAANEIDMRLAGEYDHSGRPDELDGAAAARLAAIAELVGSAGMARTLRSAIADRRPVAAELLTRIHESYRWGSNNQRVRMAGGPAG